MIKTWHVTASIDLGGLGHPVNAIYIVVCSEGEIESLVRRSTPGHTVKIVSKVQITRQYVVRVD